jgi:Rod binding domain-containing protein
MDAAAPKLSLAARAAGATQDLAAPDAREQKLRATAQEFEATFIAQMLTYAGFAKSLSAEAGFGGEAFSSLLIEQYAKQISERGGFGLSETIYQQLKSRDSAHDQTA